MSMPVLNLKCSQCGALTTRDQKNLSILDFSAVVCVSCARDIRSGKKTLVMPVKEEKPMSMPKSPSVNPVTPTQRTQPSQGKFAVGTRVTLAEEVGSEELDKIYPEGTVVEILSPGTKGEMDGQSLVMYYVSPEEGVRLPVWEYELQMPGVAQPLPSSQVGGCQECRAALTTAWKAYTLSSHGRPLCPKCVGKIPIQPPASQPAPTRRQVNPGAPEVVGITGRRNMEGPEWAAIIYKKMDQAAAKWGNFAVAVGKQPKGVDGIVEAWARSRGHEIIPCPPRAWTYTELMARNQVIVDRSNVLVAFWDGQEKGGTWDTMKKARASGKVVYDVLHTHFNRPHFQ